MASRYKVGDIVKIVDDPYDDCAFGWDYGEMDRYCGVETTITKVVWDEYEGRYAYSIAADDGDYNWCDGCLLQPDPELRESDVDLGILYNIRA